VCGITGFVLLQPGERLVSEDFASIRAMTATLRHRGPDDAGFVTGNWQTSIAVAGFGADTPCEIRESAFSFSPHTSLETLASEPIEHGYNFALDHRRLAILDLSAAGHQPMAAADGGIWLVHNGEIYNFEEIRSELVALGHRFVSRTDTEVIIAAYAQWGEGCLSRFNGMWAFVLLDLRARRLFCSRDRFGEKPFFYYLDREVFAFSSEIKGLLQSHRVSRTLNEQTIFEYLTTGKTDRRSSTFFSNIAQLRGGEALIVSLASTLAPPQPRRYWDIDPTIPPAISRRAACADFRDLLEDSIRLRLMSDVPLGACLSGGLDSSSIVCLADRMRPKINTFSSRYKDSPHDEGEYIDAVLEKTSVTPHFTYPSVADLIEDVESLVYHQDEPFGSLSIFAQWSVFKLVRETGVVVTLDGQGPDEMLGGYHAAFPLFMAGLLHQRRFFFAGQRGVFYPAEPSDRLGRVAVSGRAICQGLRRQVEIHRRCFPVFRAPKVNAADGATAPQAAVAHA